MAITIKIPLSEYTVQTQPDYLNLGTKVDTEIEKHLSDGSYVYRAIGKDDHPNMTLDELVSTIQKLGTDKYDSERKEICAEGFQMYNHDIHAGSFVIKEKEIILDDSYEIPSLFGDTVKKFYENVLLDRGYPVRIDLLLIYDASKLERAKKIDPNAESARPALEECLYKFKDPKNKKDALLTIVKLLR